MDEEKISNGNNNIKLFKWLTFLALIIAITALILAVINYMNHSFLPGV